LRLSLCGGGRGGSLRRAGTLCFLPFGLNAFGLGALRCCRLGGLLGERIGSSLLRGDFRCGGGNVGRLAAPADLRAVRPFGCSYRRRLGGHGRGGRATTPATCRCGRSRLPLGANALLPLPPGAHARDLVIGQRAQMAAHGNIHLTK
jgi:hypothetical protein